MHIEMLTMILSVCEITGEFSFLLNAYIGQGLIREAEWQSNDRVRFITEIWHLCNFGSWLNSLYVTVAYASGAGPEVWRAGSQEGGIYMKYGRARANWNLQEWCDAYKGELGLHQSLAASKTSSFNDVSNLQKELHPFSCS